jgi:hypothetical protein
LSDTLFPGFAEHMAGKEADSQCSYERWVLRKLYTTLFTVADWRQEQVDAGDEFDLGWFNDNHPLPLKLHAKKVAGIAPIHLIRSKGMTTTALWKAYFELKSDYDVGAIVGMFFPVSLVGTYVIHNAFGLPAAPGFNVVMRQAQSADKGLIIAPIAAFLASLKETMS